MDSKKHVVTSVGIAFILVGIGLLVYNLLGYIPFNIAHWAVYYDVTERAWITAGAVILTCGIFLYKRGQQR